MVIPYFRKHAAEKSVRPPLNPAVHIRHAEIIAVTKLEFTRSSPDNEA